MRFRHFSSWPSRLRGKQLLGGVVAVALLMPVPALALTFTGAWSITYLNQSGGPTPSTPTFSSTDPDADHTTLDVSMRDYQAQTKSAISEITLARSFNVSSANQLLDAAHVFTSLMNQGEISVKVTAVDSKGHATSLLSFDKNSTTTGFVTMSDNQSTATSFKSGIYTLSVDVKYATNNKFGGWKATSAHHFSFGGE